MAWFAEPAVQTILLSANKVAPNRSHASDGVIGDATHSASTSDHNPDSDGGVHACDVTHDPAGGFDAWHWSHVVADRIKAGLEKRVKYLVANDGAGPDMIFNPSISLTWRQNGSYKTEHRSHVHVSILYADAAEQDTTPFFVGADAPAPPPQPPPAVEEIDVSSSFYFAPDTVPYLHRIYVASVADSARGVRVGDLMHLYAPPSAAKPQGSIENMTKLYGGALGPQSITAHAEITIRPNTFGSIIDGTTIDAGSGTVVTWNYTWGQSWKCIPYFAS